MKALSTNALYYAAYRIADRFRGILGKRPAHQESAQTLKDAVNRRFRNPATGTYRYLLDADDPTSLINRTTLELRVEHVN